MYNSSILLYFNIVKNPKTTKKYCLNFQNELYSNDI